MSNVTIDTDAALNYFRENDYTMYSLLYNSLNCDDPLAIPVSKKSTNHFSTLATSIIGQQISVKAASAVKGRVLKKLEGKLTPESVKSVDFTELKNCGLSARKTEYLKYNAEAWETINYRQFETMSNEEVIEELIKLHGIGRWTAEMFLMFSLARPDVFSYGDLGLMKSLYQTYNYKPHYKRKIREKVNSWSPHQTLASLALWYRLDNEPVLL